MQFLIAVGQSVRLQIMHHLQLVFDIPQEPVGLGQLTLIVGLHEPVLAKPVQGPHRSTIQNVGNRLADKHLNRLDEKFQFSNPTRAQLHIPMLMPASRDLFIDHLLD